MIEGVPLERIEQTDYYRRFVLFKMLLGKGRASQLVDGEEVGRRYDQVEKDLSRLQQLIGSKNFANTAKARETILRIDKLGCELGQMIPRVQQRKDAFEGDLLKRWRRVLTLKKKNEEETKKQKDEKSTSNKNLMYLTSELLKKERISSFNLHSHRERIEGVQKEIEGMVVEAGRQFMEKHERIREMIKSQKERVGTMLDQYAYSLESQQARYLSQLKQSAHRLREELERERESFTSNANGLKEVLERIRAKNSYPL